MTSQIIYTGIDTAYPIPGRDNNSQGFRTNFTEIKTALSVARNEISTLQTNKADLVEGSVFVNSTPAVNSGTGAVVVIGGVGIGGDLYVGGNIYQNKTAEVISTVTNNPNVFPGSDVNWGNNYGTPYLTLADTLHGDHALLGHLEIGDTGGSYGTNLLRVATTATSQVGVRIHSKFAGGTTLKLITHTDTGNSFSYIEFSKNTSGSDVQIGKIQTDGTNVVFGGSGGYFKFESAKLAQEPRAISTSDTAGDPGEICWDSSYIYVCVATDSWKRVSLTAF